MCVTVCIYTGDVGAREALAQRMSSLIELKHKTALVRGQCTHIYIVHC